VIARLRVDMHGLACLNGILFDQQRCVLLRDTFTSIDASSIVQNVQNRELATQDVLGPDAGPSRRHSSGGSLDGWRRSRSMGAHRGQRARESPETFS
jgi:hypothetical protein